MYIYIIRETDTDYFKVGYSQNPYNRHEGLQTGNPRKLYCHTAFKVKRTEKRDREADCHVALSRYHVRGEWFKHSDINHIVDVIKDTLQTEPMTYKDVERDIYYRYAVRDQINRGNDEDMLYFNT